MCKNINMVFSSNFIKHTLTSLILCATLFACGSLNHRTPANNYRSPNSQQPGYFSALNRAFYAPEYKGLLKSEIMLKVLEKYSTAEQDEYFNSVGFINRYLHHLLEEGPHNKEKIIKIMSKVDLWEKNIDDPVMKSLGDGLALTFPEDLIQLVSFGYDISKISKETLASAKQMYSENPKYVNSGINFDELFDPAIQHHAAIPKDQEIIISKRSSTSPKLTSQDYCQALGKVEEQEDNTFLHFKKNLCRSEKKATTFCQNLYDIFFKKFNNSKIKQNNLRLSLDIGSSILTYKLNFFEGQIISKTTGSQSDYKNSTVKIEPRFYRLVNDYQDNKVFERVFDGSTNVTIDFYSIYEFAKPFCSDKVLSEEDIQENTDHFNINFEEFESHFFKI